VFYEFRLTIPASTPATAPLEELVTLDTGRIVKGEILFPRGCVGLVHVKVRREYHQLWPSSPDRDFAGDDAHIEWSEDLDFSEPPYTLTLVGWNEDDSYPHTVTFRFNLLPASPPAAPGPPGPPASAIIETFSLEL